MVSQKRSWEDLADAMAAMARDLLHRDSVQDALDAISAYAVDLIEGCEAAGVLELRRGKVHSLAATDDVVRASDRAQAEVGEGPCLDATRNRERVYRIADLTTSDEQWHRYAPRARQLGIASMMGLLLYTADEDNLGALNLYSSQPDVFDEHAERVGLMVASHAAVALTALREQTTLRRALDTSRSIGQAIGIVMARYGITEETAFERLTRHSQNHNIRLRDLAEEIMRTGEIPQQR